MAFELQTCMARRGAKALIALLFVSCLALTSRYYRFESNAYHHRRALFFKESAVTDLTPSLNQVAWIDAHGKWSIQTQWLLYAEMISLGASHELPMQTLLSKAFSSSFYNQDSQTIPYYYKAEQNMTGEDITIVTLVTRNRIPNLARLATQYKGTQSHHHFLLQDTHT